MSLDKKQLLNDGIVSVEMDINADQEIQDPSSISLTEHLLTEDDSVDYETGGPCQIPKLCRGHHGVHICIITAIWQFLTGVERSLVIPTLNLYLIYYWGQSAADTYYGLILAAFGLSILIANPIIGFAASKGVRVKILLIFCNILEIIGNLVYSLAPTPGICFLGRFVAGLGGGCESPLYADITRSTTEKKRTPYIIIIAVGKELGLFVGPAFTLFFANYQAHNEKTLFNVFTAPGYVMAILWILHTFILIWYPIVDREGKLVDMNGYKNQGTSVIKYIFLEPSLENLQNIQGYARYFQGLGAYLNYPALILIFIIFVGSFNSMCLEAFLPLVSNNHYGWNEIQISYTYIGIFLILLPATVCFYFMSKCLEDRFTLIISYGIMSFSYLILLIAMIMLETSQVSKVAIIALSLISCGIHAWSMPGAMTLPDSIFSKMIPLQDIDRGQTIARIVSNSAFMIGMYIGGSLGFSVISVPVIMLLLSLISCALFLAKYSAFYVTSFIITGSDEIQSETESEQGILNHRTNLIQDLESKDISREQKVR